MAIPFKCPSCGRKMRARDEQAGKKARCPSCQSVIIVPDILEVEAAEEAACDLANADPARQPSEKAKSKKGKSKTSRKYKEGMRGMSTGLLFFGVLQGLLGLALLVGFGTSQQPNEGLAKALLGIFVLAMSAANITFGVFARLMHLWVNYAVAAFSVALLGLNMVNFALMGAKQAGKENPGQTPGVCCGIVILLAFLYTAINNLRLYSRAGRT